MDSIKDVDGTEVRGARSFRNEDYSYRRVFLRSYPLHWEADDDTSYEEEDMIRSTEKHDQKKLMKKMMRSMFQWGEARVLVLRRFKHKVRVYVLKSRILVRY
ncbi:hypothetical protein LINGRAHAP2_LOCUS18303 [Linum grandiflorum]